MNTNRFNWEKFINLAEDLNNQNNQGPLDEARIRTIISRSYYGVFKQVEDFLKSSGIQLPKEIPDPRDPSKKRKLGSHERVIQYLVRHHDRQIKDFGTRLDSLREKRKKADYHAIPRIQKDEGELTLEIAQELNRIISQILNILSPRNA